MVIHPPHDRKYDKMRSTTWKIFLNEMGRGIEKGLQQDRKVGGKLSDFLTHFQLRGLPKSGREPVYVANFLLMHCGATTAPPRELNHY